MRLRIKSMLKYLMLAGLVSVLVLPATLLFAQAKGVDDGKSETTLLQAQRLFEQAEQLLREASANLKYARAIQAYEKSAALGHEKAVIRLERLRAYLPYETGLKERYRHELDQAKQNDRDARFFVAEMLEFGIGVEADFERALFWYKRAAKSGSGEAQNRLGELYANGQIGEKDSVDRQQALEWIKAAADNGQAEAQLKLANRYLHGEDVEKNPGKAFHWFERSAANGNMQAQMQAGFMLKQGHGVKQDYERALSWFELAEQQGAPGAEEQVAEINYMLDEIFLQRFQ